MCTTTIISVKGLHTIARLARYLPVSRVTYLHDIPTRVQYLPMAVTLSSR